MKQIENQLTITIFDDGSTYLFGHCDKVDRPCFALINGVRELMDKIYPEPDANPKPPTEVEIKEAL